MKIRVLSAAEADLADAVDYYNAECAGLGFEFAAEVRQTLGRIAEYPEAWPRLTARVHRCLVHRFPYGVLYEPRAEEILVVGVMHLRRAPTRWQTR
jgi:plasmid stabilization system protein ParE